MDNQFTNPYPHHNTEPDNKYAVQFEYQDLCQRLLVIKQERSHQLNGRNFKSFDKSIKKSPSSKESQEYKSSSSIRSRSYYLKKQSKGISSDLNQPLKDYSPYYKPKIQTPEKFGSYVHFPNLIPRQKTIKRLTRGVRHRLKS